MLTSGHDKIMELIKIICAVVICMRLSKDWAHQYSIIDLRRKHKSSLLSEELLASDGFWERKTHSFLDVS